MEQNLPVFIAQKILFCGASPIEDRLTTRVDFWKRGVRKEANIDLGVLLIQTCIFVGHVGGPRDISVIIDQPATLPS